MQRHKSANNRQVDEKIFGNFQTVFFEESYVNKQKTCCQQHSVKHQNIGIGMDEFP